MSPSIIPSSPAVVTAAADCPALTASVRVLRCSPPLPVQLERLSPSTARCWRCGQWRSERRCRSANDVCPDYRWAPYRRLHAAHAHQKETRNAQVS
jgi:hypothetical protein